jgi:hypothetical protein
LIDEQVLILLSAAQAVLPQDFMAVVAPFAVFEEIRAVAWVINR